ncbi:permease prefix domain 1-containing protein [Streptomyces sedi]|nr:permease prefix domain 1-containing protein [Streptomyces sedi]
MSGDDGAGDAVVAYRDRFARLLRGPARARARLVEEVADGFADTVRAWRAAGFDEAGAARRAEAEFGTPEEVAASCQRELTLAQVRHTAGVVASTAPLPLACWYLLGQAETARDGWLPQSAQALAAGLAGVAGVAALGALLALAVTGRASRWLSVPRRLPDAVGWLGTAASGAMAGSALALTVAAALATHWPLVALAGVASAACHAGVAPSARACRRQPRVADPA